MLSAQFSSNALRLKESVLQESTAPFLQEIKVKSPL